MVNAMSVVNQMLRDLEQNQSNINLDVEAVDNQPRRLILTNFRFWIALLLIVVAVLTWQIIEFAGVIEQNSKNQNVSSTKVINSPLKTDAKVGQADQRSDRLAETAKESKQTISSDDVAANNSIQVGTIKTSKTSSSTETVTE
ncbi:MAG: hypothetical protein V2I33_11550, partial [Kangiellaceae bacterium]|nr:hypothetical protein [Kangiellaceae bacterium]